MANSLTGDFDLVAEFSVLAVNRVLAAMHRMERFPHSISARVDDNPHGPKVERPTIVGSVDVYGEPTVDPQHIGISNPFAVQPPAGSPLNSALDGIVNLDAGILIPPIIPSHLQGKAQLQLFPPSIHVTDGSGKNITVNMQLMSRYFPDPNTSPIAEFVRGDLRISAPVNQVASQVGNVVEVDIKADTVGVNFTPSWSSKPFSAEDTAGVNLLIRNALKTSFLPSNTPPRLPANVEHMQFKTLLGGPGSVAVLLNLRTAADTPDVNIPAGNPASATNVFLSNADEFAFAAGVDFLKRTFQPTIDSILSRPVDPFTIKRKVLWHTFHATYTITLTSAKVDLENGKIIFEIKGDARTGTGWAPNFSFTVRLSFTLSADGPTADLIPGDVSLETDSWIVNLFKGAAEPAMTKMRDDNLRDNDTFNDVRDKLSADKNLSGFLNSLLVPPHPPPGTQPQTFSLAYTSVEIRPSGIVLHGSLSVADWPEPHVEFAKIPPTPGASAVGLPGNLLQHAPDYTALKSWIPGGTVDRYEWSTLGQSQPMLVDSHRFVHVDPPPEFTDGSPSSTPVSAFRPLCLKVVGSRLTSSGPVVAEPVSASMCGFTWYPVVDGVTVGVAGSAPMVALTHPDPQGLVHVTGHAAVSLNGMSRGVPNLVVHFANEKSAGQLELLTRALRESGREDATTAVLAVLSPDQLAKARYVPGVTYAEDRDGSWASALGVKVAKLPLTLIAGRKRQIVWRQEGEIDSGALAGALRKVLVSGGSVRVGMLSSSAGIGRLPPNFLFEYAPGHELPLRKLFGRLVTLVFWKSSSEPSIDAVRDLQAMRDGKGAEELVVLAINDGDERELAKRFAAENGLSATIVADPDRKIAAAYNVNMWPTIISLDAAGMVSTVRYGRASEVSVGTPVEQTQRKPSP